MKNIEIFPKLSVIEVYKIKCSLLLTSVPLFCSALLTGLLFFIVQLNIYYLENSGLIINDEIRQAYHDLVKMEILDVGWYMAALIFVTFVAAYLLMQWAVSPFVNAEKLLRHSLKNPTSELQETDWLSESPSFHRVVWGLAQYVKDKKHPFDKIPSPRYHFSWSFFLKFVLTFFAISLGTSYVAGIILNTAYMKIINLAINLVRMNQKGYYFLAQEQVLRIGVSTMLVVSCLVYAIIGYYIARYMSNMLFVFTRAIKEHHFPLRLRHSDVYHSLADAISDSADAAGLSKEVPQKKAI